MQSRRVPEVARADSSSCTIRGGSNGAHDYALGTGEVCLVEVQTDDVVQRRLYRPVLGKGAPEALRPRR